MPLKTSSLPAPLSVVSVTTVPCGDVSVASTSAAKVWRSIVRAFTSKTYDAMPPTTIVDVMTPASLTATGVPLSNVA